MERGFTSFLNELHTCARDTLYFTDSCSILVTFLGDYQAFLLEKWSIKVERFSGETKA